MLLRHHDEHSFQQDARQGGVIMDKEIRPAMTSATVARAHEMSTLAANQAGK